MKHKRWSIGDRSDDGGQIAAIAEAVGVGFPMACLLYRRGYRTPEEAMAFLRLEHELLHDPFLMADMAPACNRLLRAIEDGESIAIYGDYDVDGVTAVSLLCLYLRQVGAKVSYYIPDRMKEGYGVNCEAVRALCEQGTTLIVTVDTGITAVEEVAYAASLGCDVVVTDHHECHEELPKAVAVIDPHRKDCAYPFKELAGVGVAFKLITALDYTLRQAKGWEIENFLERLCSRYIDLVTLGTIADVMPLRDENRLIVSMGLRDMESATRPSLRALLDAADGGKSKGSRRMNASTIGFTVAPRINAAGRLSSAMRAVELFLSEDRQEAALIAEELCIINQRRQAEENAIVEEIRRRIEADPSIGEAPIIVLDADHWNHGVIGIVASRITERYHKPSILIAFDGDLGKGSGRSIKGLNLVEALSSCSELLVRYGGHELAAGLTVRREDLPRLRERLSRYVEEALDGQPTESTLEIDMELYPHEVGLALGEELELLEPCGISNPLPLFVMKDLTVHEVQAIGQNRHTKLLLEGGGRLFTALFFGASPEELGYAPQDICDIAFQLNINEYQGRRSEQLVIRDIRSSREQSALLAEAHGRYLAIRRGEASPLLTEVPHREDFAAVYLHLKRSLPEGGQICLHTLLRTLQGLSAQGRPWQYLRLRLALDVMNEAGVLTVTERSESEPGRERFQVTIPHLEKKVNLEESWLYKQLTAALRTNTLP